MPARILTCFYLRGRYNSSDRFRCLPLFFSQAYYRASRVIRLFPAWYQCIGHALYYLWMLQPLLRRIKSASRTVPLCSNYVRIGVLCRLLVAVRGKVTDRGYPNSPFSSWRGGIPDIYVVILKFTSSSKFYSPTLCQYSFHNLHAGVICIGIWRISYTCRAWSLT